MENNHEYVKLAESKRVADDYHPSISPEFERITRFFWWIVSGLLAGTVFVALWVANVNSNMAGFEKRITTNEVYKETTKNRFAADDLTHVQTNQQIQALREDLHDGQPNLIQKVTEMWFMKEHGISNKEDFLIKNHYPAPLGDESASTSPSPK